MIKAGEDIQAQALKRSINSPRSSSRRKKRKLVDGDVYYDWYDLMEEEVQEQKKIRHEYLDILSVQLNYKRKNWRVNDKAGAKEQEKERKTGGKSKK